MEFKSKMVLFGDKAEIFICYVLIAIILKIF